MDYPFKVTVDPYSFAPDRCPRCRGYTFEDAAEYGFTRRRCRACGARWAVDKGDPKPTHLCGACGRLETTVPHMGPIPCPAFDCPGTMRPIPGSEPT